MPISIAKSETPPTADGPQKAEGFPGQRIVVLPRKVVQGALTQALLRGLLPTDVGIFPQARGHLYERPKGAGQAIFIYCAQGEGWCAMAAQRHAVHPGELLVIPPGAPHAYGADEKNPWSILWVHVAGESLPSLLNELDAPPERPLIYMGQDPAMVALFEEIIDILGHGYTRSHLLYSSRALGHLIGLMIWHREQKWRGSPEPQQKIAQSVTYMKGHLNRSLRIADLASMVGLSVSHYSALFKRQTGYAPMDYFIRLRIHQACQLLDTTGLSVKEVASTLGYEDPLYFSRVFKSLHDLSPSEYRTVRKG